MKREAMFMDMPRSEQLVRLHTLLTKLASGQAWSIVERDWALVFLGSMLGVLYIDGLGEKILREEKRRRAGRKKEQTK